uniref:Uncharacterized protein n=1 Tax=Anguilla anguilla TaxID=7936 RepID=A0A0E9PMG5_ANGAN
MGHKIMTGRQRMKIKSVKLKQQITILAIVQHLAAK